MKRRPHAATAGFPERLRQFNETDWSGSTYPERLRSWHEARMAWNDEHGRVLDVLMLLAEYSDLRRASEGMPPWSYGRWRVRNHAVAGFRHPEFLGDRA